ncbi:hypothetical protein KsCSTR_48090 [Candidatus Kuenenia stuttgartiensis]|nr:hypothetical protein KsCSTR_48090 [Candidatus Kuenenia stuttgartiensis]SOH04759.1 hypothetical protein KSMBR1_2264 [Candidatus Kuenenia stuttgartiensis]
MPIFTSCNGYYRDIHKDTTTILLVLYNTMLFVVAPKGCIFDFLIVLFIKNSFLLSYAI